MTVEVSSSSSGEEDSIYLDFGVKQEEKVEIKT